MKILLIIKKILARISECCNREEEEIIKIDSEGKTIPKLQESLLEHWGDVCDGKTVIVGGIQFRRISKKERTTRIADGSPVTEF